MVTVLEVKNVSKSFTKPILSKVSFDLKKGEILGILGCSGEGKSTLLNIITGLIRAEEGTINFKLGRKYEKVTIHSRSSIQEGFGYSTQEPSFYDELTVAENIVFFGTLFDMEKEKIEKRKRKLLKIFDLQHAKNLLGRELSVGMKKRLDLCCSLIHSPKILILDEPTANLDFKLRDEILKYIRDIKQEGVSMIYVSHFIEEVEEISDRVLLLHNTKAKTIDNKDVRKEFGKFAKGGKKNV